MVAPPSSQGSFFMTQIIPLTAEFPIEADLPSLKGRLPDAAILLKVPTWHQRDTVSTLLFSHGFIPISADMVQAFLVEALYRVFDEATADEYAAFLDGFWQQSNIYNQDMQAWALQEQQRLADVALSGKEFERSPMPKPLFSPRDNARASRIGLLVLENDVEFRALQGRSLAETAETELLMMRLFIDSWVGLKTSFDAAHDEPKLSMKTIEALRNEIGEDAYAELKDAVAAMFNIDKVTEKNFDSPPAGGSSPTPSPAPNDGSAPNNGLSTESSTEPSPDGTSDTGTTPQSASPSSGGTPKRTRGRTAGR